jgi:2-keto-myo-inositol isomerase
MYKSLAAGAIGVRADLARTAELASKYGFDAVHVDLGEVSQLGAERASEILGRFGVKAAAFGLPVDCEAPDAKFAEGLARLKQMAPVAKAMGISRTSTWVPSWHDTLDYSANYAFHRDRFGQVAAVLADQGIRLGLEFLGPKHHRVGRRYEFIHTADAMLKLCHDVGTGNVGLLYDSFHWYTSGGTPDDIARLTDADVVDVHVCDAQAGLSREEQIDNIRALPGETGVADVPAFLRGLAAIGYSGPVMVEPFSKRVNALPPEEAVRVTAEALRSVWREAGLK